jgi:hypothetical protein
MKYLALIAVLLCSGCVTKYATRQYAVGGFTLIVTEQENIQRIYRMNYGIDIPYIGGFCDQESRVLFVRYDKYVGGQPDFFALGHEVWHFYELGGRFHK